MVPIRGSSALSGAEYVPGEGGTGTLTVVFTSGLSYDFEGVPQEVYEGLMASDSPGSYFHRNIKGVY